MGWGRREPPEGTGRGGKTRSTGAWDRPLIPYDTYGPPLCTRPRATLCSPNCRDGELEAHCGETPDFF